jgi:uncharacterized protein (DUF1697 family)
MPRYAALLRAVNVGGTGKLPMVELREIAARLGFTDVATYIQSGNLVFTSTLSAARAKAALEAALGTRMGKPCAVMVRTAKELQEIDASCPFADAEPARVLVLFLDAKPDATALASVKPTGREQLAAGKREVYIHFPDGMGSSKLKIPFADVGTGRNLNTLRALLRLCGP